MRSKKASFNMMLCVIGLLAIASLPHNATPAAAGPAPAAACSANCIFLPFISVPAPKPILDAPPDQAHVDSVAPTLTWTPAITGTKYTIQVADEPTFT